MKSDAQQQHQQWHDRWQSGRIGFHKSDFHPSLLNHCPDLALPQNSAVFVPLCGKSLDMIWLAEQGHTVIGVELSDIAARDFFAENKISYEVSTVRKFQKYQGGGITILVGDFFDLTLNDIPNIKAVYDRAALIALSSELRKQYTKHLRGLLSSDGQILLITLNYDQTQMDGPPFSVPAHEVQSLFGTWCEVSTLHTSPPEDFREIQAYESVYRIVAR